jgi:hypothetical protein
MEKSTVRHHVSSLKLFDRYRLTLKFFGKSNLITVEPTFIFQGDYLKYSTNVRTMGLITIPLCDTFATEMTENL